MTIKIEDILEERGNQYGNFNGTAIVSQSLKATIYSALDERSRFLTHDQQEALDMICHKIGRIVNGNPDYADNWIDIAGYAMLIANRLPSEQAKNL